MYISIIEVTNYVLFATFLFNQLVFMTFTCAVKDCPTVQENLGSCVRKNVKLTITQGHQDCAPILSDSGMFFERNKVSFTL